MSEKLERSISHIINSCSGNNPVIAGKFGKLEMRFFGISDTQRKIFEKDLVNFNNFQNANTEGSKREKLDFHFVKCPELEPGYVGNIENGEFLVFQIFWAGILLVVDRKSMILYCIKYTESYIEEKVYLPLYLRFQLGCYFVKNGCFHLHGAVVFDSTGALVVVLGDSNAGKTCLVYLMKSRGFLHISDEDVFLKIEKGKGIATGIPRRLHIRKNIISRIGSITRNESQISTINPRVKLKRLVIIRDLPNKYLISHFRSEGELTFFFSTHLVRNSCYLHLYPRYFRDSLAVSRWMYKNSDIQILNNSFRAIVGEYVDAVERLVCE